MNFEPNPQQAMLEALATRFTRERYGLGRGRDHQRTQCGFSEDNWRLLADVGLLALPFSAECGGLDGSPADLALVMEVWGRSLVVEPYLADLLLAGRMLAGGTEGAGEVDWLSRIITGECRVALAHVEHSAGLALARVDTTSCPGRGGNLLRGAKTMVLSGVGVSAYVVSATTIPERGGAPRIRFHVVPADAPGLVRYDYRLIDGSVACELELHEVVSTETLSIDFAGFERIVDDARLAACAEMVGVMSALFDSTLDHVRNRKQFGVAIATFQAIQHRIADLYVSLELCRSQWHRALSKVGRPSERSSAFAAAKSFIEVRAIRLGEACIQMHGGMGVADELSVGHFHRRLLLLSTMFGDADADLDRYAQAMDSTA